jgi:hypothetical protein
MRNYRKLTHPARRIPARLCHTAPYWNALTIPRLAFGSTFFGPLFFHFAGCFLSRLLFAATAVLCFIFLFFKALFVDFVFFFEHGMVPF